MFNSKQYYIDSINKMLKTMSSDTVEALYSALKSMNERNT